MKILFLTNLFPYPLDNGGKIKTYTTIKALSESGHDLDLVCFTENEEADKLVESALSKECSNIYRLPLRLTTSINKKYMITIAFRSLFSKYSFGLLKYITNDMISLLRQLSEKNAYDCVYFDHLQMYVYARYVKLYWPKAKILLDEHNCEFMIMQRNYEKTNNVAKKIFFKLETNKLKKFERDALISADKIIVLSEEDDKSLKGISASYIPTTIIPIGMKKPEEEIVYKQNNLEEVNILFVGTLSWAPNNDGLMWFLENVVPVLQKTYCNFKLYIVGKNPGDDLKRAAEKYSNIIITGYVDSVVPYYDICDFMIVPLFVGSGQRVKIIEGFSYGMPIISTSIGAEGLQYVDGENLLIANDVESFIRACNMMKDGTLRTKISKNSKWIFEQNYSLEAVSGKISATIED